MRGITEFDIYNDNDGNLLYFKVGRGDVTRIEATVKSGTCPFENFTVACPSAAEMASKFPVELLPLIPELRLLQLDCNVVTPRTHHPIVVIDRHLFTASDPSAAA